MTWADYGTEAPEDFDRFGVKQDVVVSGDDRRRRRFVDVEALGPIKRLGLTLHAWSKQWHWSTEHFALDVNGRWLEIVSYRDGRLKISLDGDRIYIENIKIRTTDGERHREITRVLDEQIAHQERLYAKQLELDEVRKRLGKRSSQG
jgi:hypothetical protein